MGLRTSRHVFTVSEFSLEEIVSSYKINRHKLSVVYNAVNPIFEHIGDKVLNAENICLQFQVLRKIRTLG